MVCWFGLLLFLSCFMSKFLYHVGGVFKLELFLPEEYPMAAPKVNLFFYFSIIAFCLSWNIYWKLFITCLCSSTVPFLSVSTTGSKFEPNFCSLVVMFYPNVWSATMLHAVSFFLSFFWRIISLFQYIYSTQNDYDGITSLSYTGSKCACAFPFWYVVELLVNTQPTIKHRKMNKWTANTTILNLSYYYST